MMNSDKKADRRRFSMTKRQYSPSQEGRTLLLVIQSGAKDLVDNHVDVLEIFRTSPQQHVFTALRSVLNDKKE